MTNTHRFKDSETLVVDFNHMQWHQKKIKEWYPQEIIIQQSSISLGYTKPYKI